MSTATTTYELAEGWRFGSAEGGAQDRTIVTLPHTWNAVDGTSAGYKRGAFVYEREWKAGPELKGKRLYLEIDAASSIATVEVGGKRLLTHRGGYSLFRADFTDCLEADGTARIRILVDSAEVEEVYPLMADFTFFGGLYRGVRVLAVEDCHFDLMDYGSPAVFVSQREVKREAARLGVEAKVVNEGSGPKELELEVRILDAEGKLVAEGNQKAVVHAATTFFLDLEVERPHLWQGVADPYLHRVEARLLSSGRPVDTRESSLGLRSFSVDGKRGFILNGVPTPLRGVCRHQDKAGKGNALDQADMAEDIALIREIGANTIRLAHYQHADHFYELCDRAGLVIWAEVPVISRLSETDPTGENAVSQLRELIRQNYNHASICFWGVQNEITIMEATPALRALVKRLAEIAKAEDPTRLSTQAQVAMLDDSDPLSDATDIVAFNKYYGWYGGKTTDFGTWLKDWRKARPGKAVGLSEYGCEGILSWHTETPKMKDYSEEYQALWHETAYGIVGDKPWIWGTYVWNMFDFASAIRDEGGVKGMNNKGLVTHDRKTRKDSFFFYKATWSREPVLHLCSKRFVERTREKVDIKVYSNLGPVTLEAGGRVYKARPEGVVAVFKAIPLAMGENRIVARAGGHEDLLVLTRVEKASVNYACPAAATGGILDNWFSKDLPAGAADAGPLKFPEGRFSIRDSIGDIISVPEGEALFRRYAAPLFEHPMFKMAKNFSIEKIHKMMPEMVDAAFVRSLNSELTKIEKPVKGKRK